MPKLLTFGICREIIVDSEIDEKALATFKSVAELRAYLHASYPALAKLNGLAIAVNEEYADDDKAIGNNDVIALIPPVSGG